MLHLCQQDSKILSAADYSSGEKFEYQYDAAGNRTAYTATVGSTQVTTYGYDAANPVKRGELPLDERRWRDVYLG